MQHFYIRFSDKNEPRMVVYDEKRLYLTVFIEPATFGPEAHSRIGYFLHLFRRLPVWFKTEVDAENGLLLHLQIPVNIELSNRAIADYIGRVLELEVREVLTGNLT